jgi:hypothetical protein
MSVDQLKVTSHVGRDLLQSAALFKHEHSVVWEYVSNGLEYTEPGINPTVKVVVDTKNHKIKLSDNGRGMTFSDLHRYFQMHGENIDRKRGALGRGLFGTGKSAAFGIANLLRVTTVRNGARSKVELTRSAIDSKDAGHHVPVTILENSEPTNEHNGTIIEIDKIQLKRIDPNSIIRHIERHIAHWPNAAVFVNMQKCEFVEPPVSIIHAVRSKGTPFEAVLGDVELKIKVAKAPLEEELQGIAIISGGVWHETSLVGSERKPFANYIFGSIEVPALATDRSPISPFDMSRSMRLNSRNELVAQIYGFLGSNIERVRLELERQDRERRNAAEAKKLAKEAGAIAEIINKDFSDWKTQIRKVTAQFSGQTDVFCGTALGDNEDVLIAGDELPASIVDTTGGPGPLGGGESSGQCAASGGKKFASTPDSPDTTADRATGRPKRNPNAGGFKVDFANMGIEEARAKYERDNRTIYINLEHPQICAARQRGGLEEPSFRRLSFEVAFSEYAIALASEMAGAGHYLDPVDPITDIRSTINRLAVAGAKLYV